MATERARQTGFSLLELILVLGLFSVIMGVVFHFVAQCQITFAANQTLAEAHQNADFASLRVAEILRGAGANPANLASINALSFLRYTDADSLTSVDILSDLNGDGSSNDNVEGSDEFTSQYYILSSENVTLQHNPDAQTIELVDNTADGSASVTLADHIRAFEVEILENSREARITITAGPSRRGVGDGSLLDTEYTVVSTVQLRNRF